MAEPDPVSSSLEGPRKGWRWRTRIAAAALTVGLLLATVLVSVVARPSLLVLPVNWLLRDRPIRIVCDDARLEAPFGWRHPSLWRWRITGFALISDDPGMPTMMADVMGFRMPDWRKSWQTGNLVIPKAAAWNFTVFFREFSPKPFEEFDAWPVRSLVVEQVVMFDSQLVLRDPSGLVIVMEGIDGQVLGFEFNLGRREVYGHGDSAGGSIQVGPFTASNLRGLPIHLNGSSVTVEGFGSLRRQRAHVVFEIDGLFRPGARLHAEFALRDANVRALVTEVLGDDAPDVDGRLWADAVFDTNPPNLTVDVTFRLHDATFRMPEETKAILLAMLKIAPFVELKDHVASFGPLSGHVTLGNGQITIDDGLYVADRSSAVVDGRVTRDSLHARVHFTPELGAAGLNWGLLVSGTLEYPKIALADPKALDAWTVDMDQSAKEIHADLRAADAEARALRRGERKRRGGGATPETVEAASVSDQ